jgi:hypothetical protein
MDTKVRLYKTFEQLIDEKFKPGNMYTWGTNTFIEITLVYCKTYNDQSREYIVVYRTKEYKLNRLISPCRVERSLSSLLMYLNDYSPKSSFLGNSKEKHE